jgi:hypothetical protein
MIDEQNHGSSGFDKNMVRLGAGTSGLENPGESMNVHGKRQAHNWKPGDPIYQQPKMKAQGLVHAPNKLREGDNMSVVDMKLRGGIMMAGVEESAFSQAGIPQPTQTGAGQVQDATPRQSMESVGTDTEDLSVSPQTFASKTTNSVHVGNNNSRTLAPIEAMGSNLTAAGTKASAPKERSQEHYQQPIVPPPHNGEVEIPFDPMGDGEIPFASMLVIVVVGIGCYVFVRALRAKLR